MDAFIRGLRRCVKGSGYFYSDFHWPPKSQHENITPFFRNSSTTDLCSYQAYGILMNENIEARVSSKVSLCFYNFLKLISGFRKIF